jgi:hypothetical protein
MPTQPTTLQLQRRLDRRQELADEAVAALAHGRRHADMLYDQVVELEDALERDHPDVVAQRFGDWATRDAHQLASHQQNTATDCPHCTAARAEPSEATRQARSA